MRSRFQFCVHFPGYFPRDFNLVLQHGMETENPKNLKNPTAAHLHPPNLTSTKYAVVQTPCILHLACWHHFSTWCICNILFAVFPNVRFEKSSVPLGNFTRIKVSPKFVIHGQGGESLLIPLSGGIHSVKQLLFSECLT